MFCRSVFAAPIVEWTMIDVNATGQQGDAHWLHFADGRNVLIDTGFDGKAVLKRLRQAGVDVVHTVLITHAHKDHYGGLLPLLRSSIKIGEVRINLPDRGSCDREKSWGCNYTEFQSLVETLRGRGIKITTSKAGDVIHATDSAKLEVRYAYDGPQTPAGDADINDTSVIAMLSAGKTRALFTGDLNALFGGYLAQKGEGIEADILKVPHHGTENVAPNTFFDRVGAKVALVPSPRDLWLSERSARVRTYFEKKGIPTHVNGLNGEVRVTFTREGYEVADQAPAQLR